MIAETTHSAEQLPPAKSRAGVSIVIVVWNAKAYVEECLSTLRDQCADAYNEVIVVDNASTDGSPELIAEMFPGVTLIRNPKNLGFAKANNIGMSQCQGKYICLVNSDVRFTSDCISPMTKYMELNPGVGMLGPKMLSGDGTRPFRSTLRFPTVWNTFCRAVGLDRAFRNSRFFGGFLMTDFDHQTTRDVEVLAGWFWVVRRDTVEQIGMLDTQFFMYGEDIDWCYRFHQAGKQVLFFADAEAYHYGGASSSAAPTRFYLEQCRGDWKYFRKHHGKIAQAAYLGSVALYHAVRLVGSALLHLLSRSRRSDAKMRIHTSVMCLQWVAASALAEQ